MSDILVVGTGESSRIFDPSFNDMPTLVWGEAWRLFLKIKKNPTHFSFTDPFTSTEFLNNEQSGKTEVCVFSPIYDTSHDIMLQHIGMGNSSIDGKTSGAFAIYISALAKHQYRRVPATTAKYLKHNTPEISKCIDRYETCRFDLDQIVIGSNPIKSGTRKKQRFMDLEENKLTMAVLPLVHFLGYKNIYLLGFDCKGGRLHKPKSKLKQTHMNSYKIYIPRWLHWRKFHGMEFYSAAPPKICDLHKYGIPYKSIFPKNV